MNKKHISISKEYPEEITYINQENDVDKIMSEYNERIKNNDKCNNYNCIYNIIGI